MRVIRQAAAILQGSCETLGVRGTREQFVVPNPFGQMPPHDDPQRFRTGAAKYADYLETAEGRLRLDLSFANLRDFLPHVTQSSRALDLGGGTGTLAVRLVGLGFHVTLLDSSPQMLGLAEESAKEAGITERMALQQGDALQVADLFPAGSFDLILCHNILEYVTDPIVVLRGAADMLRDSSSMLSVLVRNQAGEVLKAALKEGNLSATERTLTAEWGNESLYGGSVRLFTADNLQTMQRAASLTVAAERGVRVISDYLPQGISRDGEYARIFDLEQKLGKRKEFAPIARYTQSLARRASRVTKDAA